MNLGSNGRVDAVGSNQTVGVRFMTVFKSRDDTIGILSKGFYALTWNHAFFRQLAP
jgi:hypothetical protein